VSTPIRFGPDIRTVMVAPARMIPAVREQRS
jgi:hypothetical protein